MIGFTADVFSDFWESLTLTTCCKSVLTEFEIVGGVDGLSDSYTHRHA